MLKIAVLYQYETEDVASASIHHMIHVYPDMLQLPLIMTTYLQSSSGQMGLDSTHS